jgi:crossover junction endodeoxyribonuclease RuvC
MKHKERGGFLIVLGIDPGYALMGWGVVESEGNRMKLINYGCIETKAGVPMQNRLRTLQLGVRDLLNIYKPDDVAFEELFFARIVTTALMVGAARGAAIIAAAEYTNSLYEYTPMQIKQAITGYGKADKKQIQQMVKLLLKLDDIPKPDDAADAIACAITHCQAGVAKTQFMMK